MKVIAIRRWFSGLILAVVLGISLAAPISFADGPVMIEVDKQKGTTVTEEMPVVAPVPSTGTDGPRVSVTAPAPVSRFGRLASLWGKIKAGTPGFLDKALKWTTGSNWAEWSKPGGVTGALKKMGEGLLSSVLAVATGKNLEEWKDIRKWRWTDWAMVVAMTALTLVPVGKIAGAGLRVASRVGGPVVARLASRLAPKAGQGLLSTVGKATSRLVRRVPGGEQVLYFGKNLADKTAQVKQVGAARHYLTRTWTKYAEWSRTKGFRRWRSYLNPDTRNPVIKDALEKSPRIKAIANWPRQQLARLPGAKYVSSTRFGRYLGDAKTQIWHIRDTMVSKNPTSMIFSGLENIAKAGVTRNARLMQKGATPLVRKIGYAKREFWRSVRDTTAMVRNRLAVKWFLDGASKGLKYLDKTVQPRATAESRGARWEGKA